MGAPLPKVPDVGWFELEILYYLTDRERYGNEMRVMLNAHLGDDVVSTGKLYPVLKKLEKGGFIRKLKKRTKEKIKDEEGMTSRLLTRGVDRVYFEITDEGRKQLQGSISFMTSMLYNKCMRDVESRMVPLIAEIVRSTGEGAMVGVTVANSERAIREARDLMPDLDPGNLIFLLMGTKNAQEKAIRNDSLEFEVNSFPSRFDDIPLKSNYLDVAISLVRLSDVPGRGKYLSELIRTVRSKGKVIIVDYAPIESTIMEDIMTDHVEHEGATTLRAVDPKDLTDDLKQKLRDMEVIRHKELFLLTGTKPRKQSVFERSGERP